MTGYKFPLVNAQTLTSISEDVRQRKEQRKQQLAGVSKRRQVIYRDFSAKLKAHAPKAQNY